MSSQFYMPVHVVSGKHCIVENSGILKKLGSSALIVTYPVSAKNGSLDDVKKALENEEMDYVVFDRCEENPSWELIRNLAKDARASGCDMVIGLGGGSAMDAAKAAAVMLLDDITIDQLYRGEYDLIAPLVCIPTTAGTGAEVTYNAVLTTDGHTAKKSFGDQRNFADAAFLDASYTETMPARIAKETAVDALTHNIEGYLSKKATPVGSMFAKEGISLFMRNYEALKNGELDFEAREQLMLASFYSGVVIAQERTLAPHAMSYMLTLHKNMPHGRATGVLISAFVDYCGKKGVQRAADVVKMLGLSDVSELYGYIDALLEDNNTYTEAELEGFAKECIKAAAGKPNPVELDEEAVAELFKMSLLRK